LTAEALELPIDGIHHLLISKIYWESKVDTCLNVKLASQVYFVIKLA